MGRIRSKDTAPELAVRRLVHRLGYRYRLHKAGLPGSPDLVFARRRKVIFVHGCFWHYHSEPTCRVARVPKSRQEFWLAKLERNRARDERVKEELSVLGWKALEVWECQMKDSERLGLLLREFLDHA